MEKPAENKFYLFVHLLNWLHHMIPLCQIEFVHLLYALKFVVTSKGYLEFSTVVRAQETIRGLYFFSPDIQDLYENVYMDISPKGTYISFPLPGKYEILPCALF